MRHYSRYSDLDELAQAAEVIEANKKNQTVKRHSDAYARYLTMNALTDEEYERAICNDLPDTDRGRYWMVHKRDIGAVSFAAGVALAFGIFVGLMVS